MKKPKKSREQPCDRLSDLPDSIIFEIFWFLPMREVVRTTILSKRWNNLWKTTPCLNFDHHAPEFVNRALILWQGLRILKFRFDCLFGLDKSAFIDIDVWVSLAREKGVEEFHLENIAGEEFDLRINSLYSCSLLKVCSLRYCKLQIHGNVQWDQLRSLTIDDCDVDGDLINQVVSGSPQLEVFTLTLLNNDDSLNIRSSSLKDLSIMRSWVIRNWNSYHDPSTATELRIWSPNLETFHIMGVPFGKCLLMDVSSLAYLTLDVSYDVCKNEEDIFGEMLWQILPSIQHVEKLTLSDWCIEVLGATKDKYSNSPSSNLKFLTINKEYAEGYEQIVDILQFFPKLETLFIESDRTSFLPANHVDSFFHCERNLPESFLLQLRTVEINLTEDEDLIFPFIEILLKHASKLQHIVFPVEEIKRPSERLLLAQKLLRMPRSSPSVELTLAIY